MNDRTALENWDDEGGRLVTSAPLVTSTPPDEMFWYLDVGSALLDELIYGALDFDESEEGTWTVEVYNPATLKWEVFRGVRLHLIRGGEND